jgi:transketolase
MGKATRVSFGEALAELGEKYKNIVVLDADLAKSTKADLFEKKFPERFFPMGVAEANMIGVAAGLALTGFIPFICSFAVFVTGRYDTIRMSVAYNLANVKIVGTHAGIGIGEDGNSQMGLEDISLMRSLPNFVVIQPADDIETKKAVEFAVEYKGPVYLRLTRQNVEKINPDNYKFDFGKGVILKEGKDIAIFATGALVYNALKAAEELEKENISVKVINIHTIKPIDKELIIETAKNIRKIITAEDHNIIGGLGSAVAEVLAENGISAKLKRIGLNDIFGESGSTSDLYKKYGFDINGLKNSVKNFI